MSNLPKCKARLSPTSLTNWFYNRCPAAWKYSQDYELREPSIHLRVGTMVHNLMEGLAVGEALRLDSDAAKSAVPIYQKLIDMKSNLGLQVIFDHDKNPYIERKQVWRIAPYVDFVTKIDCLCWDENGLPVVVDWKSTLGNGWKTMPLGTDGTDRFFTPQMHGFQSVAYLVPRPPRLLRETKIDGMKWPSRMLYLVGPARGPVQVFSYSWNEGDYANFKQALQLVSQAVAGGRFPKVYGKHCFECEYKGPCLEPLGWQADYLRRGESGYRPAAVELLD